ncbi:9527_t:CDS:2 [Entrophospora sp. SA101]|nr:9527_t:CDS:2 [Entrophospora sp. SA101]
MSNFNEENQDEKDIEETYPISSQDALLAIEKIYFPDVGCFQFRQILTIQNLLAGE